MIATRIAGYGHYLPDQIVTSAEVEQRLGLPPGWIERRTGIRARRFARPDEAVTDLAFAAARAAITNAGISRRDIGLLLLATSTPDNLLPPSGPLLAHRLGLPHVGAMDLAGACTGFLQAFVLAEAYARTHQRMVLVVAANILSRRIEPSDPPSSVLFGDGAGALILEPTETSTSGLLGHYLGSHGEQYDLIKIRSGGSRQPFDEATRISDTRIVITSNRIAYARAIDSMVETSTAALLSASMTIGDFDYWVPHQANLRLIEAVRQRLGIPAEKTFLTVADYANSSAATIPLTLSMNREALVPGRVILMTAVGAGFTEGAIVYRV